MRLLKLAVLSLFLSVSIGSKADDVPSLTDTLLSIKVKVHLLTAGYFAYQSNSETLVPSFDLDYHQVDELLSLSISQGSDSETDLLQAANKVWEEFRDEHKARVEANDYTNAFVLKNMLSNKDLFIQMIDDYATASDAQPGNNKSMAYESAVIVSYLIEMYSKQAASMYGLAEGHQNESRDLLLTRCDQLDKHLDTFEGIVKGQDASLIKKIRSQWNFISNSIKEHDERKAVPYIVNRYGQSIATQLMALNLN